MISLDCHPALAAKLPSLRFNRKLICMIKVGEVWAAIHLLMWRNPQLSFIPGASIVIGVQSGG
jgi:hypothetical protein